MTATLAQPHRRTALWRKLLLLTLSLVLALAAAELAVRLLGLGPTRYRPRVFVPDAPTLVTMPGGAVVYQPNTVFSHVYDPAGDARGYFGSTGRVDYHINRHGLRGPDFSMDKPPGVRRVLCLGDSITFGEGVHYADSYPAVLATLLDGPVEVINAGVQAYDTVREVGLFQAYLQPSEPDVVIVGFFLNDAMDVIETVRQVERAAAGDERSWLARRLRLVDWLAHAQHTRRVQADYFDDMRASFDSERWSNAQQALRWLGVQARVDGFRVVLVIFPLLWGLDGDYPFEDVHAHVQQACAAAGIECVDLLDAYRGRPARSLWAHPTDQHPNEAAHRLAAHAIAAHLRRTAR